MRFLSRGGKVFAEGMLTYPQLGRYLRHFDAIEVVGRKAESEPELHEKYRSECSGPQVTFRMCASLSGGMDLLRNSKSVSSEIRSALLATDCAIIRLPSEHGLIAASLAKRLGKKYAVELVGCAFDSMWYHGAVRGKIYAPVLAARVRRAVAEANAVLYVTHSFLQHRYPFTGSLGVASNVELPSHLLSVGISDVALPETLCNSSVSQRPPTGTFNVGLIGSVQTSYKGHDVAIKAVAMAKRDYGDIVLRCVGPGDAKPLIDLARSLGLGDQVRFEGTIAPGADVFEWLKELDLYIQPSRAEGLPRALLEAMAVSRPALGSSAGGIPELLGADCLHSPGDWQTLGTQIARAARDSEWRETQAARNRAVAQGYAVPKLDALRDEFWGAFAMQCRGDGLKRNAQVVGHPGAIAR